MIDSTLDRIASRVRLTENLAMVGGSKAVVRGMTVAMWGGVVQIIFPAVVLFLFDEPAVAWAVIVGAVLLSSFLGPGSP